MLNLDGVRMFVISTASTGVVGADTHLNFVQRGAKVAARYAGGNVTRGWLVGTVSDPRMVFRYVQREVSGELHHGHSIGDIERRSDGRLRVVEHFTWTSRSGSGTNVFEELSPGA